MAKTAAVVMALMALAMQGSAVNVTFDNTKPRLDKNGNVRGERGRKAKKKERERKREYARMAMNTCSTDRVCACVSSVCVTKREEREKKRVDHSLARTPSEERTKNKEECFKWHISHVCVCSCVCVCLCLCVCWRERKRRDELSFFLSFSLPLSLTLPPPFPSLHRCTNATPPPPALRRL